MRYDLSKLNGGQEAINCYLKLEDVAIKGNKTSNLSNELDKKIKEVVKKNKLDKSKKWHLEPPNSLFGNTWGLKDWI